MSHAGEVAVSHDDGGGVQEPVEDADGGALLGQEAAPLFEGPERSEGPVSGIRGRRLRAARAAEFRCHRTGRSRVR